MIFKIIFYFYQLDVCASANHCLMSVWILMLWKMWLVFCEEGFSVRCGIPYCIRKKRRVWNVLQTLWALTETYVHGLKGWIVRRARTGRELIIRHQGSLTLKAAEACGIISSSGITKSVFCSGLLLCHISFLPCSDTVIFLHNHCGVCG